LNFGFEIRRAGLCCRGRPADRPCEPERIVIQTGRAGKARDELSGTIAAKRKVPARPCGQAGTNRGMGVRHALFPVPALGAHPRGGCRLPDAILHGKRSLRPRSRAVLRLAVAEFRVRLFSSLGLVVAPPACEPGQDTSAILSPRLDRLAPGQPPLLTARLPGATGLAS